MKKLEWLFYQLTFKLKLSNVYYLAEITNKRTGYKTPLIKGYNK